MLTYNGEKILYDNDGNMLYGPLDGVMTEFEYDCRNRLIRAGDTYYEYDAENIRTAVDTPEYREEYVTDSVSELSRVLVITRKYKNNSAEGISSTDSQVDTETYYYGNGLIYEKSSEAGLLVYHYNHLGSTTAITDKAGKLVYTYDYGTYGELKTTTEYNETTPVIRFLYNGQLGVATDDNGLYYMRSRYYNPEIKRFINQDVLIGNIGNSASLNRYSYVEGNPISYTDPFGLSPYIWISLGVHTSLDIIGIFFPAADVVNAFYYLFEGNIPEFKKSLLFAIPGSKFLTKGLKFSSKMGKLSVISEGIVKSVNAAGHIGSTLIIAYETGSGIGAMIDKYLVEGAELSKETAVEVVLLVSSGYGLYKYGGMLGKYLGGTKSTSVIGTASGKASSKVISGTEGTSTGHISTSSQSYGGKGGSKPDFYSGPDGVANSLFEYDEFTGYAKNSCGNPVDIVGNGHTGRTMPNNLNEQMAMRQVRSNPLEGATELPFTMKDTRWSAKDGWVKMENNVYFSNGSHTSIHFVYNKITGAFDDFKFKDN